MQGDEGSRHVSASAVAVSGEANERFRFIDPMFYVDAEDAFAWLHEHTPVFRYGPPSALSAGDVGHYEVGRRQARLPEYRSVCQQPGNHP